MRNGQYILLIEDDQVDAMTVVRSLKEIKISNKVEIVSNGEAALNFLEKKRENRPALILLDLNMPRMNGVEFLTTLKKDDDLKTIPVVALTTSKEASDRLACFQLGVAGYMIKPVDYYEFTKIIKVIIEYWVNSEMPY